MRGVRTAGRHARAFRASPYDGLVTTVLTAASRRARAAGADAWHVKLHSSVVVRATVSGDWLVLEAEPAKRGLRRLTSETWPVPLLRHNRAMPGNIKFVLDDPSHEKAVRVRAEIPLSDPTALSEPELSQQLTRQVRRSFDSMCAAHPFVEGRGLTVAASDSGGPLAMQEIATLCKEAGWSSVQGTACASHSTRSSRDSARRC
jgi:hypothetical protein